MSANDAHPLDNPLWYALNSIHGHLASGTTLAKRYPPEVAGAVALAEHSDAAFHDLAQLVPAGEVVGLLEAQPPSELPGWTIHEQDEFAQMICRKPVPEIETPVAFARLTEADV